MKLWILAAWCAAGVAGVRAEAPVSGVIPAQAITRISVAGNLIVRGKNSNAIRYTVLAGGARIEISEGRLVFPEAATVRLELPRWSPSLSMFSAGGSLDAADLNGSVFAETAAGKITLDRIGGDVEVRSGGGAAILGTIGGTVRCYSRGGNIRAVRVKGDAVFETGGGDIQLGEALSAVRALTAAGGIHIDQARAPVFVETLGGPISVLRALGLVVASSEGGPIEIGSARSVECRSSGGSIRLNNVSGSLRASTDNGSIVAEILRGHPLSDSLLSTRAGDITLFVPSDTGVSIEARTAGTGDGRSIVSEFDGLHVVSRRASVVASGKINGGGPLLRLFGAGGRIRIKRK